MAGESHDDAGRAARRAPDPRSAFRRIFLDRDPREYPDPRGGASHDVFRFRARVSRLIVRAPRVHTCCAALPPFALRERGHRIICEHPSSDRRFSFELVPYGTLLYGVRCGDHFFSQASNGVNTPTRTYMKKADNLTILLVAVFAALDIFVWHEVVFAGPDERGALYFLDVGQGDAELLVLPGGVKVLTDAGPDAAISRSLEGVLASTDRYIDLAVISHPQEDHYGGFNDLFRRYRFGAFVVNGRNV